MTAYEYVEENYNNEQINLHVNYNNFLNDDFDRIILTTRVNYIRRRRRTTSLKIKMIYLGMYTDHKFLM